MSNPTGNVPERLTVVVTLVFGNIAGGFVGHDILWRTLTLLLLSGLTALLYMDESALTGKEESSRVRRRTEDFNGLVHADRLVIRLYSAIVLVFRGLFDGCQLLPFAFVHSLRCVVILSSLAGWFFGRENEYLALKAVPSLGDDNGLAGNTLGDVRF